MIYVLIVVGIIALVCLSSWMQGRAKDKQDALESRLIAEGGAAARAEQAESVCPYTDGADPGQRGSGFLTFVDDGEFKGRRYWWLAGYRDEIRDQLASQAKSNSTTGYATFERNGKSYVASATPQAKSVEPWFDSAINNLISIYIGDPNHDHHGRGTQEELRKLGEMFNERGGINLMRTAHVEFARRCATRNVRDSSGYISAPRSLEYRWNGIGSWQS